jgi:hypothetical protein
MKRPYFGPGPAPLRPDSLMVDRLEALRFWTLNSPPAPPDLSPNRSMIKMKSARADPPLRAGHFFGSLLGPRFALRPLTSHPINPPSLPGLSRQPISAVFGLLVLWPANAPYQIAPALMGHRACPHRR